jgi:hypothetical protein
VHVAAWKNHIGLYPLPPLDGGLAQEVAPYRGAKDAMQRTTDDVPQGSSTQAGGSGAVTVHCIAWAGPQ